MRFLGVFSSYIYFFSFLPFPSFFSFFFSFFSLFHPFPSAPRCEPSDLVRWPFLYRSDQECVGLGVQLMRLFPGPFPWSIRKETLFITKIIDGEDAVSFELSGASNHYLKWDKRGKPNQEMGGNRMILMMSVPLALIHHWLPRHPHDLNQ